MKKENTSAKIKESNCSAQLKNLLYLKKKLYLHFAEQKHGLPRSILIEHTKSFFQTGYFFIFT